MLFGPSMEALLLLQGQSNLVTFAIVNVWYVPKADVGMAEAFCYI